MCARMCGLPHLPHDTHIPDEKFTMLPSVPGVFKRTQFLSASAYLRFFLPSNRVPERGSSTQAYIVNR